MTEQEIAQEMTGWDIEKLRKMNHIVIEMIRAQQDKVGCVIKASLKVGDEVVLSGGKKLKGEEKGIIYKINQKKVIVTVGSQLWSVPLSMVTKIEKETAQ
jgi:preprotein translocase subunit YajC